MTPRAFSYLRFSTPEQMRGDSFRRQSASADDYARRHGLQLDSELTFQDLGVSAFRGRNAETGRLGDFLRAVEDGLVPPGSFLLVESLDRISRQAARRALRVVEDIVERGITLVTLMDGRAYTAASLDEDPTSLLLALLTFIRANEESATKARRLQAVWTAKRARAAERPMTAVCPAWLQLDKARGRFELVEDRAAVVRRIFAATIAGTGQNSIAEALNRDGVPVFGHRGRKGRHWHRSYVAKILTSPATMGTFVPHRIEHAGGKKRRIPEASVGGYYPAVIDAETFQRAQALRQIRQPRRGRHASSPVANVLGSLARCPRCGGSMTLVTKGGNWRYLVCAKARAGAGCKYVGVRYAEVESAILGRAGQIVAECPSGSAEGVRLQERLNELDAHLDGIRDRLHGLLATAEHAGNASPALAARIAEVEAEGRTIHAEQEAAQDRLRTVELPSIRARVAAFAVAASSDPVDRASLNATLRVLLSGVVVDDAAGLLRFRWGHGGETQLLYAWPAESTAA